MTTATPHRVRLSRKAGWRLPPNTVSVARPTRWGNPYRAGSPPPLWPESEPFDAADAVLLYQLMLAGGYLFQQNPGLRIVNDAMVELEGLNLACWCKLEDPCHADVLLAYANDPRCLTRAQSDLERALDEGALDDVTAAGVERALRERGG